MNKKLSAFLLGAASVLNVNATTGEEFPTLPAKIADPHIVARSLAQNTNMNAAEGARVAAFNSDVARMEILSTWQSKGEEEVSRNITRSTLFANVVYLGANNDTIAFGTLDRTQTHYKKNMRRLSQMDSATQDSLSVTFKENATCPAFSLIEKTESYRYKDNFERKEKPIYQIVHPK